MNIPVIKTFLTLAELHQLNRCAEQLHLTKSTVSERIKQLETELGKPLFIRHAKGMTLNQAGERFYKHAVRLLHQWERAKQDIGRRDPEVRGLRLSTHPALANDVLFAWGEQLRQQLPNLRLMLSSDYSFNIIKQISDGQVDIGLSFIAETHENLVAELCFTDCLIMVSSMTDRLAAVTADDYLYLDWGWGYGAMQHEKLPQLREPQLHFDYSSLGLPWLLQQGGTAYLPKRVALPYLQSGLLKQVRDAPEFERPIFAVYTQSLLSRNIGKQALELLPMLFKRPLTVTSLAKNR